MSIFTDIVSIFAITFSLIFLVVIFFLLLCYFLNRRKQNEDDNGTEIGDVLCNLRTRTFSILNQMKPMMSNLLMKYLRI